MRQRLEPILFNKETKEGLILTSENLLRMQKFSLYHLCKEQKTVFRDRSPHGRTPSSVIRIIIIRFAVKYICIPGPVAHR